eukprot:82828_1
MLQTVPRLWPIYNVIAIMQLPEKPETSASISKVQSTSSMWFEILSRELAVLTYLFVAVLVYYYAYSTAITPQYICFVIVRDLLITYGSYGGYHWFMYQSKYSKRIKSFKFNSKYPTKEQIKHDRFYTMTASIWCSMYEIATLYLFEDKLYTEFWKYWLYSMLWLEFINHCRSIYFYWIHRVMHPWRFTICGKDFGAILYRSVHSLHHKSYNTSVWTGLSMHPIEHFIFFGSIMCPLVFGVAQHPLHVLTHKYHTLLSPIAGHDGFDFPGGGSQFHYLHHSQFECNYGTASMFWNFDKWFGTYRTEKKTIKSKHEK